MTRQMKLIEINNERHYGSETGCLYYYYSDAEADITNGGIDLTVIES